VVAAVDGGLVVLAPALDPLDRLAADGLLAWGEDVVGVQKILGQAPPTSG
jgi:hypothetical protein